MAKQSTDVRLGKNLEKSCPESYPWECWMCQRKKGVTIPCSGRPISLPKNESREDKKGGQNGEIQFS